MFYQVTGNTFKLVTCLPLGVKIVENKVKKNCWTGDHSLMSFEQSCLSSHCAKFIVPSWYQIVHFVWVVQTENAGVLQSQFSTGNLEIDREMVFWRTKQEKGVFKCMVNEKMQESMSFGAQFLRYWHWSKMPFYATYLLNCSRKVCPGNRIIVPAGDCFTLHTNLKISLKFLNL